MERRATSNKRWQLAEVRVGGSSTAAAIEMLHHRRTGAQANEWGVVFTAPLGGLRDPSNTQADLRVVFADAATAG